MRGGGLGGHELIQIRLHRQHVTACTGNRLSSILGFGSIGSSPADVPGSGIRRFDRGSTDGENDVDGWQWDRSLHVTGNRWGFVRISVPFLPLQATSREREGEREKEK